MQNQVISNSAEKRFIRLNLAAIIVTLLVILAGGIVRSTGSGMGCPDWPKCFGQYIPPTSVSELPEDYQDKFVAQRVAKNERFANTLDRLGKGHLADEIRKDPSILEPEVFNVSKTWTEYINRLMGAITGFVLIAVAIAAIPYRKSATRIFVLSVLNLFVIVFQAWLGSIVVSTNLLAWIVTVHMLLALLVLAISVYTYQYARHLHEADSRLISGKGILMLVALGVILLSILQIVIGTEVREEIDVISSALNNQQRWTWVSRLGEVMVYHRDLAIAVAVLNIILYKLIKDKFSLADEAVLIGNLIVIVLVVQVGSGILLSNFALPPFAQAVHILFATILFSLQYYLYLLVSRTSALTRAIN